MQRLVSAHQPQPVVGLVDHDPGPARHASPQRGLQPLALAGQAHGLASRGPRAGRSRVARRDGLEVPAGAGKSHGGERQRAGADAHGAASPRGREPRAERSQRLDRDGDGLAHEPPPGSPRRASSDENAPSLPSPPTIVTRVPTGTRAKSSSMSGLRSATQPSVQFCPRPPSPWISIRPPIAEPLREVAALLRRREALAVVGVRVVQQQRAVVDALAAVLLRHDPVAALGRRTVTLAALHAESVGADLGVVALHRLAAGEQYQQVLLLEDQDRELAALSRRAARVLDPAPPGGDLLLRAVALRRGERGPHGAPQLVLRATRPLGGGGDVSLARERLGLAHQQPRVRQPRALRARQRRDRHERHGVAFQLLRFGQRQLGGRAGYLAPLASRLFRRYRRGSGRVESHGHAAEVAQREEAALLAAPVDERREQRLARRARFRRGPLGPDAALRLLERPHRLGALLGGWTDAPARRDLGAEPDDPEGEGGGGDPDPASGRDDPQSS